MPQIIPKQKQNSIKHPVSSAAFNASPGPRCSLHESGQPPSYFPKMHHHHRHVHHSHHVRREPHSESLVLSHPIVLPERSVDDMPSMVLAPPTRVLVARSASTCKPDDDSGSCEKPTNISSTPIILGAAIPIAIAVVVLLYLHRRHKKKLRLEDLNDKHKSLDFGLGAGGSPKGKKGKKLNVNTEFDPEKPGHARGMSMDMLNSPYLLPAALHGSRESFHSLSRSVRDDNDPYRPVAFAKADEAYSRPKGDQSSIYTKSSVGTDRTNLIRHAHPPANSFPNRGDSRSGSASPTSPPPIQIPERSLQPNHSAPRSHSPLNNSGFNLNLPLPDTNNDRDSYFDKNAQSIRENNNYLASLLSAKEPQSPQQSAPKQELPPPPPPPPTAQQKATVPSIAPLPALPTLPTLPTLPALPTIEVEKKEPEKEKATPPSPPRVNGLPSNPRPPRLQSMEATVHHAHSASAVSDSSDYGDGIKVTPPSPVRQQAFRRSVAARHSFDGGVVAPHEEKNLVPSALAVKDLDYDPKRLSIRPLPIEDPSENAEQRANRIRSFYKEYFDETKPDPVGQYTYDDYVEDYGAEFVAGPAYDHHNYPQQQQHPHQQYQQQQYPQQQYDDYYQGGEHYGEYDDQYYGEAPHAGPHYGGAPHGGPHYGEASYDAASYGGAYGGAPYDGAQYGGASYGDPMGHRTMSPHRGPASRGRISQQSAGSSNRLHPSRGPSAMSSRSASRKPMPPPQALTSLPTPHKLKDDAMVFNPLDFAPPATFRDRQQGRRPDSPMGTPRPYSPSVRAHVPLESSFSELPAVPSPFMLRKSGTFTALDFAPPGRFKNTETGSDAASIRSYGSGMSHAQLHSLRAGAYRVSRIPKEVVGTRDDIITALKPKWNLVTPA